MANNNNNNKNKNTGGNEPEKKKGSSKATPRDVVDDLMSEVRRRLGDSGESDKSEVSPVLTGRTGQPLPPLPDEAYPEGAREIEGEEGVVMQFAPADKFFYPSRGRYGLHTFARELELGERVSVDPKFEGLWAEGAAIINALGLTEVEALIEEASNTPSSESETLDADLGLIVASHIIAILRGVRDGLQFFQLDQIWGLRVSFNASGGASASVKFSEGRDGRLSKTFDNSLCQHDKAYLSAATEPDTTYQYARVYFFDQMVGGANSDDGRGDNFNLLDAYEFALRNDVRASYEVALHEVAHLVTTQLGNMVGDLDLTSADRRGLGQAEEGLTQHLTRVALAALRK